MKFEVDKKQLEYNPYQLARKAGYGFIRDRRSGQESLVRRLGNGFYPRFHLYIEQENDKVVFSLHLDQKEASYSGSHRHNAEYAGPLVKEELERLRQFVFSKTPESEESKDKGEQKTKKSWFRKIFG